MSNILEIINNLPSQSAIVIRHAERFAIKGNDAHFTTGLTDKGLEDAFDFGAGMPPFDSYRLFYSQAKRCRQTAERICEALKKDGRNASIAGPEEVIGISYMLADIDTAFNESERFGNGFIRAWFDGRLEPGFFKSLEESLAQHLDYLHSRMQTSNGLDIHVSHDWNVMVLREGIFELRHEDLGWPGFLSGVAFSKSSDGLRAMVNEAGELRIKEL